MNAWATLEYIRSMLKTTLKAGLCTNFAQNWPIRIWPLKVVELRWTLRAGSSTLDTLE